LETVEDKIKKEIEKKNIHKKNYTWIVSILIFSIIIILYSYKTNEGIIAKQTINTELVLKNQENLKTSVQEKKVFNDKTVVQELSPEEVLKEAIVKEIIEKNIKTNTKKVNEDNPDETNDENILIDDEEQVLLAQQELEEKITQNIPIKNEPTISVPVAAEIEEPIKVIETPKIEPLPEEKNVIAKNSNQQEILKIVEPKTNFNFYKCYSFELAQSSFPQNCAVSLNEFINTNSTAKRFEIIGVIDLEDAKNLSNKSDANQALLAKNRIISTRNFIKSKTKTAISDHHYYIKSELPTRGFALRAYY
jgi:hypothetical protein